MGVSGAHSASISKFKSGKEAKMLSANGEVILRSIFNAFREAHITENKGACNENDIERAFLHMINETLLGLLSPDARYHEEKIDQMR